MAEPHLMDTLSEAQFELMLLWVDGELAADPVRLAEAEALARTSEAARAIADDWRAAKGALREAVVNAETNADFSMLRGRILTALPVEARLDGAARPVVAAEPAQGLWAWLAQFGFGKVSLAVGAATALAAWLLLVPGGGLREPEAPALTQEGIAEMAAPPHSGAQAEPAVILEEMELESGSITVHPGEHSGDATVIWHFQSAGEGEG